jgi:hypothetical protein
VGVVFPEDFSTQIESNQKPHIIMYFKSEQPESVRTAVEHLIQLTIGYITSGEIPFEIKEEILGDDMAGKHIPILRFFVLY